MVLSLRAVRHISMRAEWKGTYRSCGEATNTTFLKNWRPEDLKRERERERGYLCVLYVKPVLYVKRVRTWFLAERVEERLARVDVISERELQERAGLLQFLHQPQTLRITKHLQNVIGSQTMLK